MSDKVIIGPSDKPEDQPKFIPLAEFLKAKGLQFCTLYHLEYWIPSK